ncbi:hypothetical protein [Phaeodactylibacter luteus]|uniref:Lipoprotein n=1 Tax=Phaeodactylibacter luteus TaxID=1564516 RepID=A0A5C6RFU2_9BACT|nr:hypothetical protein [Phaeodactylibacter luteus]TXB58621.1 hypothetical protein FRY97_21505 [Phaeodactylibacter luteus]
MKFFVHILSICLLTSSCHGHKALQIADTSCDGYYTFLKKNIVKTEGGWYEFVDLEVIYKKYDEGEYAYPFLSDCLKGKDKAFFVEYFGVPHREIIVPQDDYNVFIYCFDEICAEEKKCYSSLSSMGFIVYFDDNDILIDIYPFLSYIEHYRTLDRIKE